MGTRFCCVCKRQVPVLRIPGSRAGKDNKVFQVHGEPTCPMSGQTTSSETGKLANLYAAENGKCWLCGYSVKLHAMGERRASRDHVFSATRYGRKKAGIIRLAHQACNNLKEYYESHFPRSTTRHIQQACEEMMRR